MDTADKILLGLLCVMCIAFGFNIGFDCGQINTATKLSKGEMVIVTNVSYNAVRK